MSVFELGALALPPVVVVPALGIVVGLALTAAAISGEQVSVATRESVFSAVSILANPVPAA